MKRQAGEVSSGGREGGGGREGDSNKWVLN